MNWVDFAILGIILFSMLISVVRGFLREGLSLATWVGAFFIGFQFSPEMSSVFSGFIQSNTFRHSLAFMALFTATLIIGSFASYLVVKLIHKTGFGIMDRFLGIGFGFIRGVLLTTVLLLGANFAEFSNHQVMTESVLASKFQPMVSWIQGFLPEDIQKSLNSTLENAKKSMKPDDNSTIPKMPNIPQILDTYRNTGKSE